MRQPAEAAGAARGCSSRCDPTLVRGSRAVAARRGGGTASRACSSPGCARGASPQRTAEPARVARPSGCGCPCRARADRRRRCRRRRSSQAPRAPRPAPGRGRTGGALSASHRRARSREQRAPPAPTSRSGAMRESAGATSRARCARGRSRRRRSLPSAPTTRCRSARDARPRAFAERRRRPRARHRRPTDPRRDRGWRVESRCRRGSAHARLALCSTPPARAGLCARGSRRGVGIRPGRAARRVPDSRCVRRSRADRQPRLACSNSYAAAMRSASSREMACSPRVVRTVTGPPNGA